MKTIPRPNKKLPAKTVRKTAGNGSSGGGGGGGRPPGFDLFDRRAQRIEAASDTTFRSMAHALCQFDRRTDPAQLRHDKHPRLAQAIVDVTQYLVHRVKHRAGFGRQARPFEPHAVPGRGDAAKLRETIEMVAAHFRHALEAAFPAQVGTVFPIRQFERTFAAYVGGEIRTGHLAPVSGDDDLALHGVPDGPNYFCFAEAVLLFLHCRIDTAFWKPLLRTFVGGAQYFASLYWDRSRREWRAYDGKNRKLLVPGPVILTTIDQFHAAMDSSQLAAHFTEVVGIALRDDATVPQPSVVGKEMQ